MTNLPRHYAKAPPMPERQELLDAAAKLQAATEELGHKFEAVDLFAHETAKAHARTRALTRWLTAAFAVLLAVVVVLAWTVARANDANSRSNRLQEYQVASCEAANEGRAAQLALWTDITGLIRSTSGPSGRAFATKVQARATEAFTPRDCSKVSQGKVQRGGRR